MEQKARVIYIVIYLICAIFLPMVGMVLFVSSLAEFLMQNSSNVLVNIAKIPSQQLFVLSRKIAYKIG